MREIRTFELEYGEPAVAWRVRRELTLQVTAGEIWLTMEGDAEDYWMSAGESCTLPHGVRAWVSAGGHGARLALGFATGHETMPALPVAALARRSAWNWRPSWLALA